MLVACCLLLVVCYLDFRGEGYHPDWDVTHAAPILLSTPPPILDVPNALEKEFLEYKPVGRLCEANKLPYSRICLLQILACTGE